MKITADDITRRAMDLVQGKSRLPITFIGTDGAPSTDYVLASPCIQVTVRNSHTGAREILWGCLDTGADFIYLDAQVVKRLRLPLLRNVSANAETTTIHEADLSFSEVTISANVVSRPIRQHGNGFDILVGRQFLNLGRLEYDIKGGTGCTFIFG